MSRYDLYDLQPGYDSCSRFVCCLFTLTTRVSLRVALIFDSMCVSTLSLWFHNDYKTVSTYLCSRYDCLNHADSKTVSPCLSCLTVFRGNWNGPVSTVRHELAIHVQLLFRFTMYLCEFCGFFHILLPGSNFKHCAGSHLVYRNYYQFALYVYLNSTQQRTTDAGVWHL